MHDLTTILSCCNSLTYPRDFINKLNAMIITSTFVSRSKTTAWPNAPRMDGRETTLKLSQSWRRRQDHLTDNNAVHITNDSLSYYIQRQPGPLYDANYQTFRLSRHHWFVLLSKVSSVFSTDQTTQKYNKHTTRNYCNLYKSKAAINPVKFWPISWHFETSWTGLDYTLVTALPQHNKVQTQWFYTVSQKSSTSYFAKYFRAGLTDCKNFNGYRVRDNHWTQVCNQCFNF